MARSNSKSLWISSLTFALTLSPTLALAQPVPDSTVAAALGSLGSRAGVVFAGEVTAIRPIGGSVEVDFHVSQNLKAAGSGSYTLREWSGLWSAGQRRYWVGERAVVFLNSPGPSGLSSSVDGMEGILPILPNAANTLSVDVQRLRTRVLRATGQPMVESAAQMSFAQIAAAANPRPINSPAVPVNHPSEPVRAPFVPPVYSPTGAIFPNPVFGSAQNSVVLVANPDLTDDFLFADDAEPTHKKADLLDASH